MIAFESYYFRMLTLTLLLTLSFAESIERDEDDEIDRKECVPSRFFRQWHSEPKLVERKALVDVSE
jgi:hypothetical protein